jgi:hypothetical protein
MKTEERATDSTDSSTGTREGIEDAMVGPPDSTDTPTATPSMDTEPEKEATDSEDEARGAIDGTESGADVSHSWITSGLPEGPRLQVEFDLSAADMASATARNLRAKGLLEEIEPGPEVVGVAFMVDAESDREIGALRRCSGLGEGALDQIVLDVLAKANSFRRAHPGDRRLSLQPGKRHPLLPVQDTHDGSPPRLVATTRGNEGPF